MTHLPIREWGTVPVHNGPGGAPKGHFTRAQANALIAAARAHPLGGEDGVGIVSDHHTYLRAKQMVGVIAAPGCSLEILPKVDPDAPDKPEDRPTIRQRLVQMLDVAHGLKLGDGEEASMACQKDSLLDVLIRLFADRLLAETRRGLPRSYLVREDDLPVLRGRLNVTRQFTINALRPDRLSCRFDELSSDIALLQVMKACVVYLARHARATETGRLLGELRFVLADISDVTPSALPWKAIRIDRTNRRWETLVAFARLFLKRKWQATHIDAAGDHGVTLLFPMNDLFEKYVAALLRRALAGNTQGVEVVEQSGFKHCLSHGGGNAFSTKPDIQLKCRKTQAVLAIIDTKWKRLAADPLDQKNGVQQADVYQMMAYARLYECKRVMLLYPSLPDGKPAPDKRYSFNCGAGTLELGRVDVSGQISAVEWQLGFLAEQLTGLHLLRKAA